MVQFRCSECGLALTRPLAELQDVFLLRTDEETFERREAGEPDYVPEGFFHEGTEETTRIGGTDGWPVCNPEDSVGTELDTDVAHGCCGPSDMDGLNTDCANGHKVGIERGDCWTVHCIALDSGRVERGSADEPVTAGLDRERPPDWFDAAESQSLSDRRRAIVLLGIYGIEDAVSLLSGIAADGPDSLRATAARALGRIGDPDALAALDTCLSASDATLRVAAARALDDIDDDRTVNLVLDRLEVESNREVCRAIRDAVGTQASLAALRSCLAAAESVQARETVLWLFRETGGADAVDDICDAIRDESLPTDVREQAVWELSRCDRYLSRDAITHRLVDLLARVDDPDVRVALLSRLQHRTVHSETTQEQFQRCLAALRADPETPERVREAVLQCLD